MTLRINCWSGPRNISTALMYSFRERVDTTVVDEPFYAHYLISTGIDHPSREETINSMSSNINEILDSIFSKKNVKILFLKNMYCPMCEQSMNSLLQYQKSFLSTIHTLIVLAYLQNYLLIVKLFQQYFLFLLVHDR